MAKVITIIITFQERSWFQLQKQQADENIRKLENKIGEITRENSNLK